jgi:hypothetical protein
MRLAVVLDGRSPRRRMSAAPIAAAGAPCSDERNSNIQTCCAHLLRRRLKKKDEKGLKIFAGFQM